MLAIVYTVLPTESPLVLTKGAFDCQNQVFKYMEPNNLVGLNSQAFALEKLVNDHLERAEARLGLHQQSEKSVESRLREVLKGFLDKQQELTTQNEYLREQLIAAQHTISTICEVEKQVNAHGTSWTHSDRRAIAELVIRICHQRLSVTPRGLAQEAIATYLDSEF